MLTFPVTLFAGAAASVTNTYNVDATGPSSADAYTFTGATLGTAIGTNSLVVVLAHIWSNGTNPVINAITVGGVGATILQAATASIAASLDAGCAIATISTASTSGTVVVSANNGSIRSRISVFRINRMLSTAAFDSKKASNVTPANASVSLNVAPNGVIIAGGSTQNPPDATVPSLTGITQAGSGTILSQYKWVYGDVDNQAQQTGRTVTSVLNTGGQANAIVAASWH